MDWTPAACEAETEHGLPPSVPDAAESRSFGPAYGGKISISGHGYSQQVRFRLRHRPRRDVGLMWVAGGYAPPFAEQELLVAESTNTDFIGQPDDGWVLASIHREGDAYVNFPH